MRVDIDPTLFYYFDIRYQYKQNRRYNYKFISNFYVYNQSLNTGNFIFKVDYGNQIFDSYARIDFDKSFQYKDYFTSLFFIKEGVVSKNRFHILPKLIFTSKKEYAKFKLMN